MTAMEQAVRDSFDRVVKECGGADGYLLFLKRTGKTIDQMLLEVSAIAEESGNHEEAAAIRDPSCKQFVVARLGLM